MKIKNGSTETVVHEPHVSGIKLDKAVVKKEINKIDSFDLSMHMNNPGYGKMKPLKTLVSVFNTQTGVFDFEGRVLKPSENMESDGLHSTTFTCEGELGFLHDTLQRHLEFRGTPVDLITTILNNHNSQCEEYKHFQVGNVTVTNNTNNLYVYLSNEDTTFETIEKKIIDKIGGELQIRKENGVRYLDVVERVGVDSDTEIRLSKNLVSMSRDIDPTDIVTRLTPLGTRVESADSSATDASQARLTIESVNNGLPYIDRQDLIDEFGIKGGSITWDDITIESNLYNAGDKWMQNQKVSLNQYKISALDLSIIGLDIDEFKKGNSHPTINPIMAIDERLRIIGTSKDLNEPQNGSLTIGDKFKNLYEYQNDAKKSVKAVNELESRVSRLSEANGTLNAQLQDAKDDLQGIQDSLTNVDIDNLPTELQTISGQISALQDDLNNLDIPTYELATQTTDGLMSSADKTKLDGLENYDVATDIADGLMSAEDKSALDNAVLDIGDTAMLDTANTADLVQSINELVARIETLEGGV
ncbi:MAG: phage tail protein [Tetragenococcus koreensis]|nr:phage tail protein [Tetragenococcus koreensis]